MKKYLKILYLGLVIFHIALLTGCQNTMNGFSRDVDKNTDQLRQTINS